MMRPFRTVAVLAAVAALLATASCSSSSTGKQPECSWRSSSATDDIALVVSYDRGGTLLGFDPTSGAVVGRCPVAVHDVTPPLTGGGQTFVSRGYRFRLPVVAGPRLTVVPDADGGVRNVHTGRRTKLHFVGWTTVATIGDRLLEARTAPGQTEPPTDPDSWCVLPDVAAAESSCARIPGADEPGTPSVTPAGTIGWTPRAGRPMTLGGVRGYLGTDGAGSVSGFGPRQHNALLVPASVDQRSIVFLPADAPHPTGHDATLQWAHFDQAFHETVHDTGITDQNGATPPRFDSNTLRGLAVSPDGRTLVALDWDCSMYQATAAGRMTRLPTLRVPADLRRPHVGCSELNLVRWPFRQPNT